MKSDRASDTAKVIAAATVLLASENHQPDLVAPGAAELCHRFLSASPGGRALAASARWPLSRRFWRWLERMTLPGIIDHYWRRKRWIEARCRAAIAEGYRRIVVIGAGFDTLGIRLAREFETLEVVEMDHPATQRLKTAAFALDRIQPPASLRFCEWDLTGGQFHGLPGADRRTVFVIEGLLMYLAETVVIALLEAIRARSSPETRVIASFMSRWPDGSSGFRPRSRLVDGWLRWREEPFTWAIEPEAIRGFLASSGFQLREIALTREIVPRDDSSLDGENLVVFQSGLVPSRP